MKFAAIVLAGVAALAVVSQADAAGLNVVAAENVYGDLARQIGGSAVDVTSILSDPDQDPHLFEADPSTARALKTARVTISNGADYDPWMDKLLQADPSNGRQEIVAADVAGKKTGDNPHLWYDPGVMAAVAKDLAGRFAALDPDHKLAYERNLASFEGSLAPLRAKIAALRARFAGQPVTASEPVFGYMSGLLGLDMHNEAFQRSVMNGTEPSASDVATFEDDLKGHKVKVFIYNSQADDQSVRRLVAIAKTANIPLVGVTETEPADANYQAWMLRQLDALDRALSDGSS